jgi:glycosyltransferase involved in cell wall biosynthesis
VKLSVIIPVYNEEKHLAEVIPYIFNAPCPIEREFIIVDDKSSDASLEILKTFQNQFSFKLIAQEKNSGKGSAIIRGIQEVTGDFVIIQDADFEYDPNDIPALLEPLIQNKADVVYGSRFKKNALQVHRTYHYFVNYLLTTLSNLFCGVYLTDMETCYKVFKTDLIKAMNLISPRFGIEVELTAYLAKTTARIFELPISYFPRTRLQGKKINWKDGLAALYFIYFYNRQVSFLKAFSNLPDTYHPDKRHGTSSKPKHIS